jgi:hypothetical protein
MAGGDQSRKRALSPSGKAASKPPGKASKKSTSAPVAFGSGAARTLQGSTAVVSAALRTARVPVGLAGLGQLAAASAPRPRPSVPTPVASTAIRTAVHLAGPPPCGRRLPELRPPVVPGGSGPPRGPPMVTTMSWRLGAVLAEPEDERRVASAPGSPRLSPPNSEPASVLPAPVLAPAPAPALAPAIAPALLPIVPAVPSPPPATLPLHIGPLDFPSPPRLVPGSIVSDTGYWRYLASPVALSESGPAPAPLPPIRPPIPPAAMLARPSYSLVVGDILTSSAPLALRPVPPPPPPPGRLETSSSARPSPAHPSHPA